MARTLTTEYGLEFDYWVYHNGDIGISFDLVHEESKAKNTYEFRGAWTSADIDSYKRKASFWNGPNISKKRKDSTAGFTRMWGAHREWPQVIAITNNICDAILDHMESDQYALELSEAKQNEYKRQIEQARRDIKSAHHTIELREARIDELTKLVIDGQ